MEHDRLRVKIVAGTWDVVFGCMMERRMDVHFDENVELKES
jgi:hypothetical protein